MQSLHVSLLKAELRCFDLFPLFTPSNLARLCNFEHFRDFMRRYTLGGIHDWWSGNSVLYVMEQFAGAPSVFSAVVRLSIIPDRPVVIGAMLGISRKVRTVQGDRS
jgi:hypothetical protein